MSIVSWLASSLKYRSGGHNYFKKIRFMRISLQKLGYTLFIRTYVLIASITTK